MKKDNNDNDSSQQGASATIQVPATASLTAPLNPDVKTCAVEPVDLKVSDLPMLDQPVGLNLCSMVPLYLYYGGRLYTTAGNGDSIIWLYAKSIADVDLVKLFQQAVISKWRVAASLEGMGLQAWAEALMNKLVDRMNELGNQDRQVARLAGGWKLTDKALLDVDEELQTDVRLLRRDGRYSSATHDELYYSTMAALLKWFCARMKTIEEDATDEKHKD